VFLTIMVGDLASQPGNNTGENFRFRVGPNGAQGAFVPGFQRGQGLNDQGPALGVSAIDLSGQLASYFGVQDGGVLVTDVSANSASGNVGVRAGDVITRLDAERVHNLDELRTQLRAKRDANTIVLTVIRKGSEMSLTVTLERPQPRRGGGGA